MKLKTAPTKRPQCATDNGYRVHLKAGERACFDCMEAHRVVGAEWRERTGRARPPLKPCGTRAAYKRHLRSREQPCPRCRLAKRHDRDFVEEPERRGEAA